MDELRDACESGDLERVKAEVQSGTDPKEWDEAGWAAIHWAAVNGHCSIIKHLIEQCGVGVDDKAQNGLTALHLAGGNGQEAVVKMLVDEFNADANIKGNNGQTALDWAMEDNNLSSE